VDVSATVDIDGAVDVSATVDVDGVDVSDNGGVFVHGAVDDQVNVNESDAAAGWQRSRR
jgi:hypothetical protein